MIAEFALGAPLGHGEVREDKFGELRFRQSDNCTGIGVVAGFWAGIGMMYGPYLKMDKFVHWRSYLQISSVVRPIDKTRNYL